MSLKPETRFKNRIRPQLQALSPSWWVKIQQVAIIGTPDFLGCFGGRFVAIELKKDARAKLKPMQVYNLEKIIAAGGLGLVAYPENWHIVFSTLQKIAASSGGPHG